MSAFAEMVTELGLTEAETAKLFDVTVGTLRNWRSAGRGPAYIKVADKGIRYPVKRLKEYIAANTIDPSASHVPTLADSQSRRRRRQPNQAA